MVQSYETGTPVVVTDIVDGKVVRRRIGTIHHPAPQSEAEVRESDHRLQQALSRLSR